VWIKRAVSAELVLFFSRSERRWHWRRTRRRRWVWRFPRKNLPDEIPRNDFAVRVLAVVEDRLLGSIMTRVIRDSTDYILNKEMTRLADDVMKFKKVIGTKMHEDESLSDGEPVRLERMKDSFEAGWKEWRSGSDNREDLAYQAFVKTMTSPTE